MSESEFELAQLMARFKLHVRKHLGLAVDLEQMANDKTYASAMLRAVENEAEDEDLLILLVRLRSRLNRPAPVSTAGEAPAATDTPRKPSPLLRDHRFGARG
ncbi:hypothetical protein D8I35_16320 [Corticibacter populi]|uniref:Uncharacterized protein n=1 Tax=Corticibacter populi TaxID=1550736 RepID=A0A3M6QLR6_9BURK|nr:hypothetical protein [Corticibacter populi]RMX03449.1 hypothetical protein D8I35_16320 [Corticibacter populi]RZS29886.1 hypothetical protein EV687_3370 [Corticibacter populi]